MEPIATQRFPKQIKYIIGNEACERFSYYGMRSILVVVMTSHLLFTAENAKATYHLFISIAYLLPLVGGWLSDRILGKYKTILFLSLVYCLGHLCLALFDSHYGLYLGLLLVAIGTGAIKPSVAALVGDQFTDENKHLLKKVFDMFYFSVNFGAFFSALLIPVVLKHYGPGVAFGIPGILMAIATAIFWAGRKHYVHVPPARDTGSAGFVTIFIHCLKNRWDRRPGDDFWDGGRDRFSVEEIEGAKAAAGIFKVFITVSAFWSLFDQQGSSWVLQAQQMNLNVLGMQLEASQIQAVNPILVLLLIPLFSLVVYPGLEKRGFNLTPLKKMSAGMMLAGFSFVSMGLFQGLLDRGHHLSVVWQLLPYMLLTCSEIMVSITGLEFAYTQAPRAMKSTIMSFWLLTVFVGNLLTAYVEKINVFPGAMSFYFFAILMFGVSGLFVLSAKRYKVRNFIETVTPENLATAPSAG
jgi:POT family proton-dependent oligopeptide transporter